MIRRFIRRALNRLIKETFVLWQRLGIHVTPVHFYQPVPDTRELGEAVLRRRTSLVGIDMREQAQLDLLVAVREDFGEEYEALPRTKTSSPTQYFVDNDTFTSVDGEILYSMIRRLKPRRMIEVGSGRSTLLAAQALRRNEADGAPHCDYTVCDPFPGDPVSTGVPGVDRLIRSRVQDLDLATFEDLADNDILFIDSSHVLRIGSDVQFEILEVIPRVSVGVHIHVHDVFLPREYPSQWIHRERWFWNEQYVLQALLAFNSEFEVVWAGSYMHLNHPDAVAAAFSSYGPSRQPGSIWFRRSNRHDRLDDGAPSTQPLA